MQNRAHIVLLTSSYPKSTNDAKASAGLFVKDFAHELSKKVKVTVISQMTEETDSGRATQVDSGIEVIRFPWAGMGRPLSTLCFPKDVHLIFSVLMGGIWTSLKFSRQNKVDVILALWAIPSGIWALLPKWLYGVPYVVWCLGSDIWDYGSRPFSKNAMRTILRQASALFADGFQIRDDVQALSGKECLFLSSSRRMNVHVATVPDVMPKRWNYLFIGRYHSNKGPDILIDAVAKLAPEIREQVHFYLFGGGPLERNLRQQIKKEGLSDAIKLGGYIEEKEAVGYFKACDALIIPSRVDSIPVVLSDALQTGCPVIVSDVGDTGRLVREYRAGIVFPPNYPAKLAQAIEKEISHPRDFSVGRKRLLEIFDLSKSVEHFIETTFRNISR